MSAIDTARAVEPDQTIPTHIEAEVLELRARVQSLGTDGHAYREGKIVGHQKAAEERDLVIAHLGDLLAYQIKRAETAEAALQAQPAPTGRPSQAALDVLAERQRQISAEGWTPGHDDEHAQGELAAAAATYAISAAACCGEPHWRTWPFQAHWWKPTDDRRDLVKAGALIQAEIERLDRAAPAGGKGKG